MERNSPPVIIGYQENQLNRLSRSPGKSPVRFEYGSGQAQATDLSTSPSSLVISQQQTNQHIQRLLANVNDLNQTNILLNPSSNQNIQKILANCNRTNTSDEEYDSHEDENSIVDIEDVEEPSKKSSDDEESRKKSLDKQSGSDGETSPRKSPEFFIPGTPIRPTPFSALAAAWGQGVPIFGVPPGGSGVPGSGPPPGMSGSHPGMSGATGVPQGGWQRNPFIGGHPMFQVSGQGQVFGHGSGNGE